MSGINGDGTCISCNGNYYGVNCDQPCPCVNGTCNKDTCICSINYYGNFCEQKCIGSSCLLTCTCNNSDCNDFVCDQNITISNQQSIINSTTLTIQGDMNIEASNLNLSAIQIIIEQNATISNTSLFFNSSYISAKGCIDLTNTNITVDLSKSKANQQLVLFNSSAKCLNGHSYSISYTNQQKCLTAQSQIDTSVLLVLTVQQQSCETGFPWIIVIIVVCSVVALAIIFVLVVLLVPKLKNKIFSKSKL